MSAPTHDITVVMGSHAEGDLLLPTLAGFERMRRHAVAHGLSVRLMLVADRATEESRAAYRTALETGVVDPGFVDAIETDFGRGSLARNAGVAAASGRYIATADSDNIYSENWLTEAFRTAEELGPRAIVHPAVVRNFDQSGGLWATWSSSSPVVRPWMLVIRNFWDAACLTRRETFLEIPYHQGGPALGLGPGDWWWNLDTLAAGYTHEIASETLFYYRVKQSSSTTAIVRANSLVGPTPFLRDPEVGRTALAALAEPEGSWHALAQEAHEQRVLTPGMLADWSATHGIEPLIPEPTEVLAGDEWNLGMFDGDTQFAVAYWALITQIVGEVDTIALVGTAADAERLAPQWARRHTVPDRPVRIVALALDESEAGTVDAPPGCEVTVLAVGTLLAILAEGSSYAPSLLARIVVQSQARHAWFSNHPLAQDTLAAHPTTLHTVTEVEQPSTEVLGQLSVGLLAGHRAAEVNGTLASLTQDDGLPAGTDVLVMLTADAVGHGEVELVDPATRAELLPTASPTEAWDAVRGRLEGVWQLLISDDVRLTRGCLDALVTAAAEGRRAVAAAVVRDQRPVPSSLTALSGVCLLVPADDRRVAAPRVVETAIAYAIPRRPPGGGAPLGEIHWWGSGSHEVAIEDRFRHLNLGCGLNHVRGWLNIDGDAAGLPDVTLDLRYGITLPADSVDRIYSEHLFEHLPRSAGEALLRECFRVLRPGGVIRTAMPDLTWIVREYLGEVGDWQAKPWREQHDADTACAVLNTALREWGHTYVYDAEDFSLRLGTAGFAGIVRCENGASEHPELQGLESREGSRLVIEATKPGA